MSRIDSIPAKLHPFRLSFTSSIAFHVFVCFALYELNKYYNSMLKVTAPIATNPIIIISLSYVYTVLLKYLFNQPLSPLVK